MARTVHERGVRLTVSDRLEAHYASKILNQALRSTAYRQAWREMLRDNLAHGQLVAASIKILAAIEKREADIRIRQLEDEIEADDRRLLEIRREINALEQQLAAAQQAQPIAP
jgi:hypothetical protein